MEIGSYPFTIDHSRFFRAFLKVVVNICDARSRVLLEYYSLPRVCSAPSPPRLILLFTLLTQLTYTRDCRSAIGWRRRRAPVDVCGGACQLATGRHKARESKKCRHSSGVERGCPIYQHAPGLLYSLSHTHASASRCDLLQMQ